jgi:integrase
MSKDYNHEIGYESLLADFKRYNKETPKGVTLVKKGQNIYLQFKTTNKNRAQYACACSFTLDGMVKALSKAHKVAEKLKESSSETEFWQWYDSTIKESVSLKDDQLTFAEAIAAVESSFWNILSRTKRVRDKENASDLTSWNNTYGRFYKLLPQNKVVNLTDIKIVVETRKKGTKTYETVVSAMKHLAKLTNNNNIFDKLSELEVTQTEYKDLQTVTMEEFLAWRNKALGLTTSLHPNVDLNTRKAWLWVFSMQVAYGLRISEAFAIQNLDKPFVTKDGVTVPALSDVANTDSLIVIGEKTIIGTSTKTGSRISRPIIPPKYPNLIELLEIKKTLLPTSRPRSTNPDAVSAFWKKIGRDCLVRWDAPVTQTHAFRHLANINGIQAGISLEVRAQSLGHSSTVNDSVYKKRQHTQTTIDLLLNSNSQAIDFVTALNEAKRLVKDGLIDKEGCALLMAKIYQKDSSEIIKLL